MVSLLKATLTEPIPDCHRYFSLQFEPCLRQHHSLKACAAQIGRQSRRLPAAGAPLSYLLNFESRQAQILMD